jgi:hypothetical protein
MCRFSPEPRNKKRAGKSRRAAGPAARWKTQKNTAPEKYRERKSNPLPITLLFDQIKQIGFFQRTLP